MPEHALVSALRIATSNCGVRRGTMEPVDFAPERVELVGPLLLPPPDPVGLHLVAFREAVEQVPQRAGDGREVDRVPADRAAVRELLPPGPRLREV